MKKLFIIALLIIGLIQESYTQKYLPCWESIDTRPIPEWFENAKFGIFIHWGVYSVPAYRPLEDGLYASYSEWYYARVYKNEGSGGKAFHDKIYGSGFEYRDFAPLFKAELWDPVAWAKIFKNAGARYVVLTSKHHDGFCLWPTESRFKSDWNSMSIGPKRDLLGELSSAVRNEGLKMGIYYSIIEWESSRTNRTETGYYLPYDHIIKYSIPESLYVDQHLLPQLTELVNEYRPSLIFADGGEWDETEDYWRTLEFLTWLYNDSPVRNEVVVNDRFAKGMPGNHGDYYSSEYKDVNLDMIHPWEESRGIGGSYGYNRAENLENYSSSSDLVHELIDIVSRGGNLLLNVGPTSDGRIPVIQQQRLSDIGKWLEVNGDAIYATRKSFMAEAADSHLYFTEKNSTLYVITTRWPDRYIEIRLKENLKTESISMLGHNMSLRFKKRGNRLRIFLPQLNQNQIPCNYAWAVKIDLEGNSKN